MAKFAASVTAALESSDWDGLRKICESSPSLSAQTLLRGLDAKARGSQAMEECMSGYMIGHRQKLDQGLMILGTLGNNAPFIGLFGTVLGIIIAFRELALNPQGGASVVMRGISEALIATAVGLIVAIPAVMFHRYFRGRIAEYVVDMEKQAIALLDTIDEGIIPAAKPTPTRVRRGEG